MSGIKLLLILVIAVLIVVLFKYVQIKRQIRNLSKQMTDLTTGKSEKMLDCAEGAFTPRRALWLEGKHRKRH